MADLNVNNLLVALNVKEVDKFVLIREHDLADSNFVITHLMKQIFSEPRNKLCLIIMHNTIGHYHNVGKKLGYDLLSKVSAGDVETIEPMSTIYEKLIERRYDRDTMCNTVVTALLSTIKTHVQDLRQKSGDGAVYVIIDDLSHFFDIGVDVGMIVRLIGVLLSQHRDVNFVINMHVGDENDDRINCALEYNADVHISVAPLSTGRSQDVTGVLTVASHRASNIYHYKCLDKGIRTFKPGESLNYLYR